VCGSTSRPLPKPHTACMRMKGVATTTSTNQLNTITPFVHHNDLTQFKMKFFAAITTILPFAYAGVISNVTPVIGGSGISNLTSFNTSAINTLDGLTTIHALASIQQLLEKGKYRQQP
jgi:hypothetical protein